MRDHEKERELLAGLAAGLGIDEARAASGVGLPGAADCDNDDPAEEFLKLSGLAIVGRDDEARAVPGWGQPETTESESSTALGEAYRDYSGGLRVCVARPATPSNASLLCSTPSRVIRTSRTSPPSRICPHARTSRSSC
jgi:hypothetical protein